MSCEASDIVAEHLRGRLDTIPTRPFVSGICGAQGSGKSWLVAALAEWLRAEGLSVCAISLDDLYRTRALRSDLARDVHPLFAVRGAPGTHNVALGIKLLDTLAHPGFADIPQFDKAMDDRTAPSSWQRISTPVEVVLLEGWCVGATPQAEDVLTQLVNALEAQEDGAVIWRRMVNSALHGYRRDLFARLDTLILLKAPRFEIVASWRAQQEETLRGSLAQAGRSTSSLMDAQAIRRFISHFERLTRHILKEMPDRADLVVQLDEQRRPQQADG